MKRLFYILLLMIPAFFGNAQISFEHLTKNLGLPNNNITCITQDKQGFMWFGSYNGLTRYDGNNFLHFNIDKEYPYKIKDNQIRDLYVDKQGLIYIGFNYKGFAIYDPVSGTFRYFRHNPKQPERSLIDDKVFSISPASSGKVWIATRKGLDLFDPLTGTFSHFLLLSEDGIPLKDAGVSSVTDNQKGEFWIYTLNNELIRYRSADKSFKYYSLPVTASSFLLNRGGIVFRDSRNQIWIGTEHEGLFTLDTETEIFTRHNHTLENRPYKVIMDIIEDEENNIWVATDGDGIIKFSACSGKREELVHQPANFSSITTNAVYSLYCTQPGIIWAGCYAGGVNIYKKNKRKFHGITNHGIPGRHLNNKSILCFSEGQDGKILIGTDGGGLNIFDPETGIFSFQSSENGYCFDIVKSLLKDSDGRIWAGSYGAGACLTETNGAIRSILYGNNMADQLNHPSVWSMAEDKTGKIWIGLLENGIDIIDPSTNLVSHLSPQSLGLTLGNIYSILKDSRNRIWLATEENCLLRFNPKDSSFTSYNPENTKGFYSNYANVVMEDSRGNLWVGFQNGGVSRLSDANARIAVNLSVKDGLPGSSVHGILEDKNGLLWFSTDNGLASYDPESRKVRAFGLEDGLVGLEFNKGATYTDKNGYLYFGCSDGLVYFHPDSLYYNPWTPATYITSIKIFNREISPVDQQKYITRSFAFADKLTLTHKDYIVSFEFSTLDYMIPEKNRYAYMLEGFDKDWVYIGADRRYATYTSLPPGTYRFLVKASNNDGLWNNKSTALEITVLPPWWKSLGFKIAGLLFFSAATAGIMVYRIRNEKARRKLLESLVEKRTKELNESNATKDKLLSIIAHDLKGPVNSIKGLASMLENHYHQISEKDIREGISHISRSARSLSELVNNLFSWARLHTKNLSPVKQLFSVEPVIERILAIFRIAAAEKGIELSFKRSALNVKAYADPNMYETVVRNLVNNAIKFTERGGLVIITCKQKGVWTSTIVKDTGVGMDSEQTKRIFSSKESHSGTQGEKGTGLGLTICNDFVQANGGTIFVKSRKGEGTEFEVNLKSSED